MARLAAGHDRIRYLVPFGNILAITGGVRSGQKVANGKFGKKNLQRRPALPLITTTRPPAHPKTTKGDILAGEFGRGFRGRVNSRGFRPLFRGIWAGEFGREFGGNSGGIRPRFRGIRPRHCLRNPTARCAGASNELHRVVLV